MEAQGRPTSSVLAPMAETHLWRQIFKYSQFPAPPSSWEEKAFAEDTAGPLGGSVWPPRSYSCNFCMREFRSAQALGGHMNVHRRDRARLQQSLIIGSHIENLQDQNDPNRPFTAAARVSMGKKQEEEGGFSSCPVRLLSGHEKASSLNLETDDFCVKNNRSASGFCGSEAKLMTMMSSKRAKVSVSSVYSRTAIISGSSEELDLELRLGDPPRVN